MRHLLALALIVVGLGAAGKADIQEAQRHASQYCLFVADGTWPAYNSEIDCNKE
tara:strand:+ start:985 stop:1146 length:162 start_codon:yes stop_codon:yes gene_type:complete